MTPTAKILTGDAIERMKKLKTDSIDLLRYLIRSHSKPGNIAIDFTCGSGSTGVAALLENRNFIGIESDPAMSEKAREWLEKIRTGGPLFETAT